MWALLRNVYFKKQRKTFFPEQRERSDPSPLAGKKASLASLHKPQNMGGMYNNEAKVKGK